MESKKFIFRIAIVMSVLSGCSTTGMVTTSKKSPAIKAVEQDIRSGFEVVSASNGGGQALIPQVEQHVLTVDPYPVVNITPISTISDQDNEVPVFNDHPEITFVKLKDTPEFTATKINITPKQHPLPRKKISPEDVWKKVCSGKKLSEQEQLILDKHPIPELFDHDCSPEWEDGS